MPWSINGTGTRYVGEAEFRPDGSYVTTLWYTVCLIPILPVESVRVGRDSGGAYREVEDLPMAWRQVLKTYLFIPTFLGWWALCIWVKARYYPEWEPTNGQMWLALIFVFPVPFYGLGWARRRARLAALRMGGSQGRSWI